MRRLVVGIAALVVAALVATGIAVAVNGSGKPSASGLARFYGQRLQWTHCHKTDLCSWLTVPLDYADPGDGATVRLAVLKRPARMPSHRIGSIVVDPGGPGVGGTDWAEEAQEWADEALTDRFDIVGFDPRGTGRSDPIRCLSTSELDDYLSVTSTVPTDAAERQSLGSWVQRMGSGCLRDSPAISRHLSTVDSAHDMDVLRAALGERKLTYFGFSYGTYLGTVYADLFPHRVGRFVLDGAVDPAIRTERDALGQAVGFETDLDDYLRHCVHAGHCFLGATLAAAQARVTAFLDRLATRPMRASDGRLLTQGNGYLGILELMYDRGYWPYLTRFLKQAFHGNASGLLRASDWYTERGPSGYLDNEMEAFYAISCADNPWSVPVSKVPSYLPEFEKAAPLLGAEFAWDSLPICQGWKPASDQPVPPVGAPGAGPILVLGTTRDPATPLKWAKLLTQERSSAELVTRRGDGHTAYDSGNACIDLTVDDFLIRGTEPPRGKVC